MRNGFRIFDTHTHVGAARHSGRLYSVEQLLRDMDRRGVDRSVVIPFPVVEDAPATHDLIGRSVRSHPERLAGAACLYPFIPEDEFRNEVRRCREEFGFRALKLQPQYHGLNPLSARSDFLFESAIENGMSVICHTGAGIPYALPSMFMPAARKFPDLNFILAHCGGGGTFFGEAVVAASFCPNVYLELSSLMPNHVLEVLAHVDSSRLMIGSDLPENQETELAKILGLDVSDQVKADILFNTADRIFRGSRP